MTRREVYQPDPLLPPASAVVLCNRDRCGAYYVDDDRGRFAHRAVFGHSPAFTRTREDGA